MNDWESLMKGKAFITDLGEEKDAELDGVSLTVGRYAVWLPIPNTERHQVVEVGQDLEQLQMKHGIPMERVCHASS